MEKMIYTTLLLLALATGALSAYGEQPVEPIEWDQLPAETRDTLAPMANRWDRLMPRQQHRLVRRAGDKDFQERAERWKKLSPEERERIQKARQRFKDMPPERREKLRQRWENMSEEERKAARNAGRKLGHLSLEERREAQRAMGEMTPAERREYLETLKPDKGKWSDKNQKNRPGKDSKGRP